jgi:hypothetical protein
VCICAGIFCVFLLLCCLAQYVINVLDLCFFRRQLRMCDVGPRTNLEKSEAEFGVHLETTSVAPINDCPDRTM